MDTTTTTTTPAAAAGSTVTARSTVIPAPGFADPTRDAQRAFRSVLDALAHPGSSYPLTGPSGSPAALGPGLGALALTVLDEECTVWLDDRLVDDEDVASWLTFHTGVRTVDDPADADFVVATPASVPPLATLAVGTDESPDGSATVVLDVRGCRGPAHFTATGPGIDGQTAVDVPWVADPGAFLDEWSGNTALFPRGVDLLLVDAHAVSAFPRTTRLAASTEQEA